MLLFAGHRRCPHQQTFACLTFDLRLLAIDGEHHSNSRIGHGVSWQEADFHTGLHSGLVDAACKPFANSQTLQMPEIGVRQGGWSPWRAANLVEEIVQDFDNDPVTAGLHLDTRTPRWVRAVAFAGLGLHSDPVNALARRDSC